jgi:hypothetical protein
MRGGGCGLPLQAGRGIAVVRFAKRYEIGVVGIIILHKDALILKSGDRDTILVVFSERCDAEAKGGSWSQLLSWRCGLAPV